MVSKEDQIIAQQIVERLRVNAVQHVKRIILYGSRSRGIARSDSDYDFLVIEQDLVSRRDEIKRLREAASDLPYPIDAWMMGEEEFEETKGVIGGLAYPANKYGIVIYANP
jgi:uncharacterized protein